MKTKNVRIKLNILLLLLSGLLVGCGSSNPSSGTSSVVDPDTGVETVTGPYWDEDDAGSAVSFKLRSVNRFNEYANENFDDPQNVQININLQKTSDTATTYEGTLRLGFREHTRDFDGSVRSDYEDFEHEFFSGGSGLGGGGFDNSSTENSNKYNRWYTDKTSGKRVFKAFFQDEEGPIILIIDKVNTVGDGQAPKSGSGSLWFKRFSGAQASQPNTVCWIISLGPYDCRPWKSGRGIDIERAINPDNGYRKLGTFSGLDLTKALDGDPDDDDDDDDDDDN